MKKKPSKITKEPVLDKLDMVLVRSRVQKLDIPGPPSQYRKPKATKKPYIPSELEDIAWRLEKVAALNDRIETETELCGKFLQRVIDRLESEKNINGLLQVASCLARYETRGFALSRFCHEAAYRVMERKPKPKKSTKSKKGI
jgi:hypothetical protein